MYANGSPVIYIDPTGEWWFGDPINQGIVDGVAGFGDTLSFGITRTVRDIADIGSVDYCSGAYSGGEWVGVGYSFLLGGTGGWKAAGQAGKGMEFSHWLPDRYFRPLSRSGKSINPEYKPWLKNIFGWAERTRFNGNYVTPETHALSDPYRYRRMPKTWKANNPIKGKVGQQFTRIPNVYKGAALGGAYGGASAAINPNGACQCGY